MYDAAVNGEMTADLLSLAAAEIVEMMGECHLDLFLFGDRSSILPITLLLPRVKDVGTDSSDFATSCIKASKKPR